MKNLISGFARSSILVTAFASLACGASSSDELVGDREPGTSRRTGDTQESTGIDAPADGTSKAPDTTGSAATPSDVGEGAGALPGVPFTGAIDTGPATFGASIVPAPVYREVLGWAGWLCADLGETLPSRALVSSWYRLSSGQSAAAVYTGSCAALSTDPAKAAYGVVPGWPEYKCATLPDGNSSMWFLIGSGVRTAVRVSGSCASWAR